MVIALLSATGIALGLIGLVMACVAPKRTLQMVLRSLDGEVPSTGINAPNHAHIRRAELYRVDMLLGRRLSGYLENAVADRSSLQAWLEPSLRLCDTSLQTLCSQAVLGFLVGLLLPVLCWGIVTTGGMSVSTQIPLWSGLLFAVCGAALPFIALASEVKHRRREARRVVGTFLDLVVLCLAGGMGIEGALHSAAQVGDHEISAQIDRALMVARDSGETPWHALAQLGSDLGIGELGELAAAVGLAGSHGARVRSTLTAKAASIRRHEMADAEAEANAVTERLFLPGVFLLVGFLLFIGYPAVARIVGGF